MDMNSIATIVPWFVMLSVFIVMAWLQSRVIDALKQALLKPPAPTPVVAAPVAKPAPEKPVSVPPTFPPNVQPSPSPVLPKPNQPSPVAAPPPKPAPVVAASTPFGDAPPWFSWALREIGFREKGVNLGTERYISLGKCGALGDPWCAIFMNAALESSGIPGTRSASSQSFRNNPNFVQLSGPALGAIAVFWRGSKDSGLGHVGMYRGEDDDGLWILGGNEDDMVQIEELSKVSKSFGLVGYWWPKSYPLPKAGKIIMPTGSASHVQIAPSTAATAANPSGNQTNIVATYFGNQASAYGGMVDDNAPGVALPYRFSGTRPRVRVTKGNLSVDCDIVDVGPWNTNDPYWLNGSRPQAETGTDMTGRKTNKAGIDLTLAASKAIQLDGKGLVTWSFIDPNLEAVAKALQPHNVSLT